MITSVLRSLHVDPITAGLFAVIFAILAIVALWKKAFAMRARDWPTISAKIESVFVFATQRRYGEVTHSVLGYSYCVAGDYYSGEIHLEAGGQKMHEIEANLVGKEISVHFNPAKPEVSVYLDDSVGDWLTMDDPRTSLSSWLDRGR